ncbi:MAG: tail fiber domain-containing protein [Bacteroidales bacterium]|jgi:hypothetical protein|nr:tail fiber domain-containing protein [Bacteroidales bacterium]
MKKFFLVLLLCSISWGANAQLKVSTYGNVGIGTTTPQYKFDINLGTTDAFRIHTWTDAYFDNSGDYGALCLYPYMDYYLQLGKSNHKIGQLWVTEVNSMWVWETSDMRFKENIRPIASPLQRVKQLNGIQYTMKSDNFLGFPNEQKERYMSNDFGFIAQDLQRVFPELVVADNDGMLGVKYTRLVPILVEAIKEQQEIIDSLKEDNHQKLLLLETELNELRTLINSNDNIQHQESLNIQNFSNTNSENQGLQVFQNSPNPFNTITTIQCYVPSNMQNVKLCVYDMQGTQRKCIPVQSHGALSIQIEAGELSSGIYIYLLQSNGTVSEAKQMIITQ